MSETINELNTLYNEIHYKIKNDEYTNDLLVSIYTKGFYNQIKHHILIYKNEPFRFLFHENCDKQVINKVLDTLNKDEFEGVFIIQNSKGGYELVVPSSNWTEIRPKNIYKLIIPDGLMKNNDYFKYAIVCSRSRNLAKKISPIHEQWTSHKWVKDTETDKLEIEYLGEAILSMPEGLIGFKYFQG